MVQQIQHTGLKKHHKIMIGGASGVIIILLLINSFLLYLLYGKLQYNVTQIENEINEMHLETQSQIGQLTQNLIETRNSLGNLDENFQSLDTELAELKTTTSEDFSGIVEDAIPAVVTIRTDVAQGSGFLITETGYVVTNAHVLSGGRKVHVINSEQKGIEADFIGYEADLDVALVKIPGKYNYLELGDSDKLQVGEKVIAIGNPLGLQFSVSEGIVSALKRPGPNGIEAYIQTDAALNPGNSGGPLINKQGKVIGINNFKVGGGESLGFALESNTLKQSINNIAQEAFNQTLI